MATGAVVFNYDGRQVPCRGGAEQARGLQSLDSLEEAAADVLELPTGTFDLFDSYGQIKKPEDLKRAVRMAHAGKTDCFLEVKEHIAFQRLKSLEAQINTQAAKQIALEAQFPTIHAIIDERVEAAKKELQGASGTLEAKIESHILPVIEEESRNRVQLQKEVRAIQEKLGEINVQEMKEMSSQVSIVREEIQSSMKRVEVVETSFGRDKTQMETDIKRNSEDLSHLSKYITGKIDVCIEADADLKRDLQLTSERMQLMADDLRLQQESLRELTLRASGALEESEELRTLLGTVREDNEHLRNECGQVRTRVHVIEGTAAEQWEGFAPGVLYFRRFHASAKGLDVQLSGDLSIATGRGFLATTGVVMGNDEGLCVGDGPCRRFGTPGSWSAYFEIEIDEICAAPAGSGGLYVGVCMQNGEELFTHPRKEFDGWLLGGHGKALVCRAAAPDCAVADLPPPSALQPAAFGSDITSSAAQKAAEALKVFRKAMPPKTKGEVRELAGPWSSDSLRPPDRVGVLFKCHREGGARLRILVNGEVKASHEFIEAPPAEAMGFVTPVVRLAGTGKSVKLLPGLSPPTRALAD